MAQFLISIIISLLSATGVIAILSFFLEKQEKKRFRKWLDDIEKELKKREREAHKNGR